MRSSPGRRAVDDLDGVRAATRAAFAAQGLDVDDWNISVYHDPDEGDVRMQHAQHRSHGGGSTNTRLGRRPEEGAADVAAMIGRLVRRDATLAAMGSDPENPPAWAHEAHPVAIALMRHVGIDPDLLGTYARSGVRLSGAVESAVSSETATPGVGDVRGTIKGTVCRLLRLETDALHYNDAPEGPRLLLPKVPVTLVAAMSGRRLREIVSHPALDHLDVSIVEARLQPTGTLHLGLERQLVPIGDRPAGMGEWR